MKAKKIKQAKSKELIEIEKEGLKMHALRDTDVVEYVKQFSHFLRTH